jgi:hypothetical protein
MKPNVRRGNPIATICVAIFLVGFASSCGRTPPTAPTTSLAGDVAGSPSAASPWLAGTTTWRCLTESRAGILQPAGCRANGSVRSTREVIVGYAVPGPSENLSASVTGDTVTLSWSAATTSDPATSYVIEAGSSPGAANLASFDTLTTATALTVLNVPPGTYFVRVRAANSSGLGAPSNEIVVTVGGSGGCVAPPGAPTNLSAAVSGSSVALTWAAPGAGCPATTYVIEAGSASGQSNLANFNTGTSATSYSASNVPNGTYFVRVRGSNGATVGTASNEVILTIGAAPAAGVAGRWVGLVANGDGYMSSTFCDERYDWQLDLAQAGSAVTGTLTQRDVITCPGDPSGRTVTAPLSGTASNGNFSFTITTHEGRSIAVNVTFTASRMTGTTAGPTVERGTVRLNKQ